MGHRQKPITIRSEVIFTLTLPSPLKGEEYTGKIIICRKLSPPLRGGDEGEGENPLILPKFLPAAPQRLIL